MTTRNEKKIGIISIYMGLVKHGQRLNKTVFDVVFY